MEEQSKITKIAGGERFEGNADGVDLKGEDTGELGIFKRLGFTPNYKELEDKSEKEIMDIVETTLVPVLWEQCEKLGYWPNENKKPYDILRQDDGSYLLISFLEKGNRRPGIKSAKDISNEGIIGVNMD